MNNIYVVAGIGTIGGVGAASLAMGALSAGPELAMSDAFWGALFGALPAIIAALLAGRRMILDAAEKAAEKAAEMAAEKATVELKTAMMIKAAATAETTAAALKLAATQARRLAVATGEPGDAVEADKADRLYRDHTACWGRGN